MSQYNSPMSNAHRKHIYINHEDPRAENDKELESFRSKIGSKVIVNESKLTLAELQQWPCGWYLRTQEDGVDFGAAIAPNPTNVFISTESETSLITDIDGIQTGEILNYLNDIWKFYKTLDYGILGYVELPEEYLEAYYFLERFIVNSARFYPIVPYSSMTAAGGPTADIYVSMNTDTETSILKYLMNGDKEWERTIDIVAGDHVCIDSNNRLYSCSKNLEDLYLFAFETNGTIRWSKSIGDIIHEDGEVVKILVSDGVYVIGFNGVVTPDSDIFIIKFDLDGNLLWSEAYDNGKESYVTDAAINSEGVLVSGIIENSSTDTDGFVIQISKYGTPLWARKIKSENINEGIDKFDYIKGCGADNVQNYICGTILTSNGEPRVFAAGVGGAFPLGTFELSGYFFNISNTTFSEIGLTPIINDISANISVTSRIAINSPDGIYGDAL